MNACLNTDSNGIVYDVYYVITPAPETDTIQASIADYVVLDDNVTVSGTLITNGRVECAQPWSATQGPISSTNTTSGHYTVWNTTGTNPPSAR